MNRLTFILALLFASEHCVSRKSSTSLTIPIGEVIKTFYKPKSLRFNLIAYGEDRKWCDGIISELHNRKIIDSASKLIAMEKKTMREIDESAIIFFRTEESYAEFNLNVILSRRFAKNFKFLMVFGSL